MYKFILINVVSLIVDQEQDSMLPLHEAVLDPVGFLECSSFLNFSFSLCELGG